MTAPGRPATVQHNTRCASITRMAALLAYTLLGVTYLAWRALFTINGDYPVYAWVFFAAETSCVLSAVVFYFLTMGRVDPPVPKPLAPTPTVDVFIATYNEEVELVRTTAVAARDMDEPHRTWICDDGRRPAMEALARELGIGYLTRPDNAHAKAGNLNHALAATSGEFTLILDADHVPRRELLTRLLGYFADPQVAVVQTPQVFYNVESYQHYVPRTRGGGLWHESTLFHHAIQPGAARMNAAFFVGTGALLRRSALAAIGGFAQGTITEDIHTSLRLHAAGYRLVYVDEPLGFLLAPDTAVAYACQRLRWAQGAMQVLRRERALWRRGLTLGQRLGYLNALTVYLTAYYHLVFYLAPGLFIFGGITPISADAAVALPVFTARIAVDALFFKSVTGRKGRLFLSECFRIMNLSLHIRASWALLAPGRRPFRVTPKGRHGGVPLSLVIPTFLIALFNLTAVGIACSRLSEGQVDGGLVLAAGFAGQFALAGALAGLHAYERRSSEEHFVFPVAASAMLVLSAHPTPVRLVDVRRVSRWRAYITGLDLPTSGDATLDCTELGLARPVRVRFDGTELIEAEGSRLTVSRLSILDMSAEEGDRLEALLFNGTLPRFLAGHAGSDRSRVPGVRAIDGDDLISAEAFLPVRSGIL